MLSAVSLVMRVLVHGGGLFKARTNVSAAAPAGPICEFRLEIGQPDVIRPSALADRIRARVKRRPKKNPPVNGPTGLRGHRRSRPRACLKLLWRPGQLTKSDGVRHSNRSVWSGFRPDMSEGAWQVPLLVSVGTPLVAEHGKGCACWAAIARQFARPHYLPFAFGPCGRTPASDGKPNVSRRWATEPFPRS
jgi:hypothetical protein